MPALPSRLHPTMPLGAVVVVRMSQKRYAGGWVTVKKRFRLLLLNQISDLVVVILFLLQP